MMCERPKAKLPISTSATLSCTLHTCHDANHFAKLSGAPSAINRAIAMFIVSKSKSRKLKRKYSALPKFHF